MVALTAAGVVLVTRRGGVSGQGGLALGEADDAVDLLHGPCQLRQWTALSPGWKTNSSWGISQTQKKLKEESTFSE